MYTFITIHAYIFTWTISTYINTLALVLADIIIYFLLSCMHEIWSSYFAFAARVPWSRVLQSIWIQGWDDAPHYCALIGHESPWRLFMDGSISLSLYIYDGAQVFRILQTPFLCLLCDIEYQLYNNPIYDTRYKWEIILYCGILGNLYINISNQL